MQIYFNWLIVRKSRKDRFLKASQKLQIPFETYILIIFENLSTCFHNTYESRGRPVYFPCILCGHFPFPFNLFRTIFQYYLNNNLGLNHFHKNNIFWLKVYIQITVLHRVHWNQTLLSNTTRLKAWALLKKFANRGKLTDLSQSASCTKIFRNKDFKIFYITSVPSI